MNFTAFIRLLFLQTLERFVLNGLYCHTLHFNKPFRSANRCTYDNRWLVGEALVEQVADYGIVTTVTQVDDEMGHVIKATIGFAEKGLYVFPHPLCLFHHIFLVYYHTFVVDTGST